MSELTTNKSNSYLEQAAILLLCLGEEAAATVMQKLSREEVVRLSENMARLSGVKTSMARKVINNFFDEFREQSGINGASRSMLQGILNKALGTEIASSVINGIYGDVFTIPEGYIPKVGAKIMSLQDPTKKMSKSDPEETFISLLDDADTIRRKIKRAVTDSDGEIRFDPENKPGVSNLLSIMSALGAGDVETLAAEMAGKGYGDLKARTTDCVIAALEPLQAEYKRLIADKTYLQGILDENAKTAAYLANKTLRKVQKKVGFAARG